MSIHNVYCLGTGHSSNQGGRLLYDIFNSYDRSPDDRKQLMQGLGTSAFVQSVKDANKGEAALAMGLRGTAFGKGWGNVVKQVITRLQEANQTQPIYWVNLVGHSRGAVTCHMIAHAIAYRMPRVKCNIYAIDPVPGGVFDFSPWWELSAADRAELGLDGKSPEVLPENVDTYLGIYMEKDTNTFFGVLGPGKLILPGENKLLKFLPMYGKHGDCVKSDTATYPASRIALSILMTFLSKSGVDVNPATVLTTPQYVEEYAKLYLNAIAAGDNPKSVANYSGKKVAGLVAASVLSGGLGGLVLQAGHWSSYWRNRRASDIPNTFRANPYFLNFHHRDEFQAVKLCLNVAEAMKQNGFMSRTEFEQFETMFPKSCELLVRTGLARSLQDSATMTAEDRSIFSRGDGANIKRLEIQPSPYDMKRLVNLLGEQLKIAATEPSNAPGPRGIFSPEAWTQATYVRFGSRGDQVFVIDQLLPEYHRYRLNKNWAAALRIACWIGEQAEEHLRTKRRSDRRKGMVQLAKQVLATLP